MREILARPKTPLEQLFDEIATQAIYLNGALFCLSWFWFGFLPGVLGVFGNGALLIASLLRLKRRKRQAEFQTSRYLGIAMTVTAVGAAFWCFWMLSHLGVSYMGAGFVP